MCGIAGIISPHANREDLKKMLQELAHRGPDYTGTYLDEGFAGLGHNRLSIIDLSPEANEPFEDHSGRYYLTFNGEIYNYKELRKELEPFYKFKTSSDTEVLLAAYVHWGKKCLDRFIGMFAFAVWDSQEKKLFAARDRFGVKPFYFSEEEGSLYFGSEIKALTAILGRKNPNEKVWANYFAYGSYGMPGETFYEEICQLPGGHYLEFSKSKLVVFRWYDFVERVARVKTDYSETEAKEVYGRLLEESLKLRFRSDVKVGFNLSGGVDSSLLLALVNCEEGKENVEAFTFYTGDSRYDELYWVEEMISTTSNPLTKVKFEASEVREKSYYLNNIQEEPYGGIPTLAYSKLFEEAAKQGVKVLLDGQGMDEQWAGYDYYLQDQDKTIQGTGRTEPFKKNVLSKEFASLADKPLYPQPFDNRLQNMQYRDLFYTKIPRALRFNDRVSMAYSIELREPFLDHRLVEFAFAQPEYFKIRNGVQKYLLREILKPLVTEDITYAPKRLLQTPQREWLGDELKDFVENNLKTLENSPSFSHWFNHGAIKKEWGKYLAGDNSSSFHIWQWVNTALLDGNGC